MMRKNCFACLGFILVVMFYSPYLLAGVCTIDSNTLDRGERKAFIICGADIPPDYILQGLSETNITIEYEQYLEMCDIGIEIPGIYLILKAEDNAITASVSILDAETNDPVCEGLTIEVPDRVHIPEASLIEPFDPNLPFKILEIKADASQDLSKSCTEELTFPEGKWPSLSLLSPEDVAEIPSLQRSLLQLQLLFLVLLSHEDIPLSYFIDQPICTKSSIFLLVKVHDQQRYPAKIIISKVGITGEEKKEGISYVMLSPPEWRLAMRDEDAKYIDVNGIETRYFEKGKGDALLLVHGGQAGDGGNSAQSWEQNYDYLSQHFHVYALDRLGQGYTDNPKTEKDYDEYYQQVVDHVYGFMKAVGIKKVHLIGHSQGGWPVTRIALDHPELVKSLVNVDGSPAPRDPLARWAPFFTYMLNFLHPPEGPTLESIRRGIGLWSYSMNNITDEKVEREYMLSYLPKTLDAAELMTKHGVHPGNPSYLALQETALEEIKEGKLKVPTLLIWGYHDVIMHHEVGIELFKLIINSNVPGSRLVIFDECDHFAHIEYPELFNRTIKSFCGKYSFQPID